MRRRTVPDHSQISGRPLTPFGRFLADELNERHWSKVEFCERAGVSTDTIGSWLYHENRTPKPDKCALIAQGLGVPLWRVLEAAGHPYDGMLGVPRSAARRALWRKIERMSDDEVERMLGQL